MEMNHDETAATADLVRWTFTADPDQVEAIEAHLDDLGADVVLYDDGRCVVTWEEPDIDLEPVVEALWAINGAPFDITGEEFRRVGLHVLHHEGDGDADADDEPAFEAEAA